MRLSLGPWRAACAVIAALSAVMTVGAASTVVGQPDAVVGRFSVDSAVGGAVWGFQPGGRLIVVGPGDLVARGTWSAGPQSGEVDASLTIDGSGQVLTVLGAMSPDGQQVALYVAASEAATPDGWTPWPPESRLLGERLAPVADVGASPTPTQLDCLRPSWGPDAAVDWDRCAEVEASASPLAVPSPPSAAEPSPAA